MRGERVTEETLVTVGTFLKSGMEPRAMWSALRRGRGPDARISFSVLPSMYSMAMKEIFVSGSSPMSWMVTMLGCERMPAVCASRTKRSRNSVDSESSSPMLDARIVLMATIRPMTGSLAR